MTTELTLRNARIVLPADAVGLTDRGVVQTGKRADLVRVRLDARLPVIRSVWREGRRVA